LWPSPKASDEFQANRAQETGQEKTAMGFDVVFSGENLLKAIEARKMKNSLRAEGKDIPEQGRSRPRIATR
jgi:hypothetical protein